MSGSRQLVVEAVTGGLEVFDGLGEEWRELLDRVENDCLYWRPEWIVAALRAASPKAKIIIITVREHTRLCAVLPLVQETGKFGGLPARKLRAPLTMPGVGIDIACAPSEAARDQVIELVWRALRDNKAWDVLELPSVYENAAIERLSSLAQGSGYPTGDWGLLSIAFFSIPLGPAAAKELERYPRHPKLRSKVRQRKAKLGALGTVQLRRTERDGGKDLQHFYDMEASGWKGEDKSAILCDGKSRQFFDEVVQAAEKLGHLCLYSLILNGKSIAAHLGFTYRGRYWAAKSTYDEKYRDYGPGHLIVDAILQDCSERQISEYIMGTREDWKVEWTEGAIRRRYRCIFNQGLWPRLLYLLRFPLHHQLAAFKRRILGDMRVAKKPSAVSGVKRI